MKRIICLLLKTLAFATDSIPECNLPADGRTVRCLYEDRAPSPGQHDYGRSDAFAGKTVRRQSAGRLAGLTGKKIKRPQTGNMKKTRKLLMNQAPGFLTAIRTRWWRRFFAGKQIPGYIPKDIVLRTVSHFQLAEQVFQRHAYVDAVIDADEFSVRIVAIGKVL